MSAEYQIIDLGIFIAGLLAIGLLRKSYGDFIGEVFGMVFSRGHIVRYSESANLSMRTFLTYSVFIYFFTAALFLYRFLFGDEFVYISEGALLFAVILGTVVALKFFQYFVYYITGLLTFHKFESQVIVNTDLVLSVVAGIIMLLPSVFYPFLSGELEKYYLFLAMAVFGVLYLLKIFYSVLTVFGRMPVIHILLLILSVEILPVAVIVKFIHSLEYSVI